MKIQWIYSSFSEIHSLTSGINNGKDGLRSFKLRCREKHYWMCFSHSVTSLVAQMVKHLPTTWETQFSPWVGKISWRRKWHPTPVFLPGKSHGWRNLVGYSPLGHKESDTTEQIHFSHNDTKPQTQLELGLCKSNWYFEEEVRWFCSEFSTVTFGTSRYAINSCLAKNSKKVKVHFAPNHSIWATQNCNLWDSNSSSINTQSVKNHK